MASHPFSYNRVLKLADFDRFGVSNRKDWEVSMAMKTLDDLGAVRPDAEIIGVGAGNERTIYLLSTRVRRVWATDLYLDAGSWDSWHGPPFMIDPGQYAPAEVAFDRRRIVAQHADMRDLPHPDGAFDAAFSSGSIEHVGEFDEPAYPAIEQAAREMGRVLKPGGILSLSTEWKVAGEGWGWENVRLFDEPLLRRHIIEPSGCELVGQPDWSYDGSLDEFVVLTQIINDGVNEEGFGLLAEHQFKYTSVHLALRKPQ